MIFLPQTSLINSKIAQFYKIEVYEELDDVAEYFQANGVFNTEKVVGLLWPNKECREVLKAMECYHYEDYLQCYNKLSRVLQYTNHVLNDLLEKNDKALKIHWMGKNANVYSKMRSSSYPNSHKTETVEHILILTSILANALTNVYLSQTQGRHPPHLLKDLINSEEIGKVFGFEMVLILKILMGSPNSINLRNIVWHGFPKPMEIPSYYVSVLLITMHSLGCIIESKDLHIKERVQITTFHNHIKVIEVDLNFECSKLKQIEQEILRSNTDFEPYWLQLLTHYKSQNYKEFVILILTQIELLLRILYGQVNNFDISAKLDEYYITMDSIFETEVRNCDNIPESLNKLLDFENSKLEGCFHFLYDIFISPNGCRLRDKVSHGEVFLEALNNEKLCSLLLNIFLSLLCPEALRIFDNYESKLHLNAFTKQKINTSSENLNNFKSKHLLNKQMEEHFLFSSKLEHHKVLIFKRPKKESEFMLLINKIAENLDQIIANYEESIAIRSQLLVQRELHSKRRKTLENLQKSLPHIFRILSLMLSSISKVYEILQNNFATVLENDIYYDKTLRFLKHTLTISENFVKYSNYESNEWIKSLELCRKYEEFHKKLFLYDNLY